LREEPAMANPAAGVLEQARTDIDTAMAALAAQRAQPGSDKVAIDAQLDALQDKSDALDAIELRAEIAASQQAIDAVNAAG
jgi:flagellin-like hook-associated protein FlgL